MPSLSNQLAALTETVRGTREWITSKFKVCSVDHDEVVKLRLEMDAINKRLDGFDNLKRALIVGVITAFIGGGFSIAVAIFSLVFGGD